MGSLGCCDDSLLRCLEGLRWGLLWAVRGEARTSRRMRKGPSRPEAPRSARRGAPCPPGATPLPPSPAAPAWPEGRPRRAASAAADASALPPAATGQRCGCRVPRPPSPPCQTAQGRRGSRWGGTRDSTAVSSGATVTENSCSMKQSLRTPVPQSSLHQLFRASSPKLGEGRGRGREGKREQAKGRGSRSSPPPAVEARGSMLST